MRISPPADARDGPSADACSFNYIRGHRAIMLPGALANGVTRSRELFGKNAITNWRLPDTRLVGRRRSPRQLAAAPARNWTHSFAPAPVIAANTLTASLQSRLVRAPLDRARREGTHPLLP